MFKKLRNKLKANYVETLQWITVIFNMRRIILIRTNTFYFRQVVKE